MAAFDAISICIRDSFEIYRSLLITKSLKSLLRKSRLVFSSDILTQPTKRRRIHLPLFASSPVSRRVAIGRCFRVHDRRHLVARLATIKNALVRRAKGAGAVFTGKTRYRRQRKKGRRMKERKRPGPGEEGKLGRPRGGRRGYNLIRLPFGLIFE